MFWQLEMVHRAGGSWITKILYEGHNGQIWVPDVAYEKWGGAPKNNVSRGEAKHHNIGPLQTFPRIDLSATMVKT